MKKGFTILEMILVLTVVSVIIMVTVPNIAQKRQIINDVGCKALKEVVNGQILLYQLQTGETPDSIDDLIEEGFISEEQGVCPNGERIKIDNGQVEEE